jgi:hypothetical protein
MTRQCSGCSLCCKLLPMPELDKAAGTRCHHQRTGKGCAIYARRPMSCALWNCRWLINDDTADLRRPDRAHYVIDIMPDFITLTEPEHESANVEVVQIWLDPDYPDAYKDPALLDYLARRGEEGIAAIIRSSASEAFVLFPPALTSTGTFKKHRSGTSRPERTIVERMAGIAEARRVKV